jgi:tetratricopeptide (TPR) repeat protein
VRDDLTLAEAEGRRGLALLMLGQADEALAVLDQAIRIAESAEDLDSLRRALNVMADIHRDRGEFRAATSYIERALGVAERQGDPAQCASLMAHRGGIAFLAGDWAQARADCEQAVTLSRQIGTTWALAYTLPYLGQLRLAEGAWEEAARCLEEVATALAGSPDLRALRLVPGILADCELLEGRPRAALECLAPVLDRPGLEEWGVLPLLPRLARAYLELGDVTQSCDVLAQGGRRARQGGHRLALVETLWVQSMVAIRQQRWDEAIAALDEGLSLVGNMHYPYAEARLLHQYGLLHAQKGEPMAARGRLSAALEIFRRLGARKDAEHVDQALEDLQGRRTA